MRLALKHLPGPKFVNPSVRISGGYPADILLMNLQISANALKSNKIKEVIGGGKYLLTNKIMNQYVTDTWYIYFFYAELGVFL